MLRRSQPIKMRGLILPLRSLFRLNFYVIGFNAKFRLERSVYTCAWIHKCDTTKLLIVLCLLKYFNIDLFSSIEVSWYIFALVFCLVRCYHAFIFCALLFCDFPVIVFIPCFMSHHTDIFVLEKCFTVELVESSLFFHFCYYTPLRHILYFCKRTCRNHLQIQLYQH